VARRPRRERGSHDRPAKKLDPSPATAQEAEDQVQSVITEQGTRIAKARFAIYGKKHLSDATFTLRLTYGPVAEYKGNGS